MESNFDYRELVSYIDPSSLSYAEWAKVGMALKHEGCDVSLWDGWSSRDVRRYHPGECEKKWRTFRENTSDIVTGGTIYQMATENGFCPSAGLEYDWDSEITAEGVVVAPGWADKREVTEPKVWRPGREAARYIETLFEPGETIGFVMQSRLDEEKQKYIPRNKGSYTLTAGQILEKLATNGDDLGTVFGDYDPKAGAWIRFNPLDGGGVTNRNVTEHRYALVESDDLDIEQQNGIIRELELPVAVLMFSGGKSIHAVVKVDAPDYREYQKRVEYLYQVCEKNGLKIDTQNKNPSRLSRLPGCVRGDKKQFIIDTNIGKSSWNEWKEWIESINDDLPDIESLSDSWDNLPELAPPLIDGILRQGHKMLIAGPSKAGKSFLQIELCIAIAEGRSWLGRSCARGRVLYVNLELDAASCLHRFKDVYQALGIRPDGIGRIEVWNLRGKSVPMDKLAPKLIRRAQKKNYTAIIIDPIYKVITGDENSAEQMAKFCNQFDRVCTELECAVIYCHHHSKGAQGGKKSMDRASGSGVFSRDPDAQLDMIELTVPDAMRKQEENKAVCAVCKAYLDSHWNWKDDLSQDDLLSAKTMRDYCENVLDKQQMAELSHQIEDAVNKAARRSAWRLETTLREFPELKPINVWFDYPAHYMDDTGALGDIQPEVEKPIRQKKQKTSADRKKEKDEGLRVAFEAHDDGDGRVKLSDLAEYMGVTLNTVKKYVDNSKVYEREDGVAVKLKN
ncbi:MAG: AAA family ATPase [Clostridiales bacterium]|nr:AAA family ATPase [Clostridiales bacterium]